jgi:hypothetical protein
MPQRDLTMPASFHRVFFASMICLVTVGLAGCHHAPDETLIRQAIDASAGAAEHADAAVFSDQLSNDFTGEADALDRQGLLNLLRIARLRGESIHAILGPVHVQPRGDRFVATFTATLTSGGKLLPADIGVYAVETGWRREDRRWLCYSASWHQQL